jgi:aminopeptidase N
MRPLIIGLALSLVFSACKTKKETVSTDVRDPKIVLDTITVTGETREPVYRASNTRVNDLLHTRIEISFSWEKQHAFGKATLTLRPYFYPTDSLTLDAKGFLIDEVSLVSGKEKSPLQYDYRNQKIYIKLNRTYKNNETYQIFVKYTARPNELPKGGSAAISSAKGLYFINPLGEDKDKPMQIWTQGETESNSCWFPTIDSPNERMTQELYITIEDKYVTLCNGLLISSTKNPDGTRTDYWKQDLGAAPYLTMMAIGEYALVKDQWKRANGKPMEVNYYVEKDYERDARAIFGNTPEMLTFYSKILGVEYPWEKYSQVIVRDYVSGAMENTGAVIHGEFMQRTTRELIDGDAEDVIAHELFHHWFGDLVTCESWSNLPLNESFATYGEYLWNEYKYGREEADLAHYQSYQGYLAESSRKKEKLIRFDYEDKEDMFDGHSYNKGGQILHMLRKLIGDDAFFASLKLYLEKNKFKSVEIHDFRLAVEEITGKDMNWFFNQWFFSPGHPELIINHNWDESSKKYILTIKQIQDLKKSPLFHIPAYVDIYQGGNKIKKEIVIKDKKQDFVFELAGKPDLVNFDPEKSILCTRNETMPQEQWFYLFKNSPLYLERNEALSQLSKKPSEPGGRESIMLALKDRFWKIRISGIEKASNLLSTDKDAIKEIMLNLANSDPKSLVRAEALEFLTKHYKDASLEPVFLKALKDSSYSVQAKGLRGLVAVNPVEGNKVAKSFESEKNLSLLLVVASIYAEGGKEENNEFFLKIAPRVKSFSNITFLSHYVRFLEKCSDETVLKSLPVFERVAKGENSKWVKYFGQKGVNDLVKVYKAREESLQTKIKEMKETNPNATGLSKLENDLVMTRDTREKLSAFYNSLLE